MSTATAQRPTDDTKPATFLGLIPRGVSRYSWLTLLNTWLTWALNVVTFTMVYSLGTVIIEQFHLSPATWGFVVAGYLGIRVLFDLPTTILSDRLGDGFRRKYVWFPLMMLYAVVGSLIAIPQLSGSLWSFCLLLVGVAIGTTASEALGVVATSEWWPREHRGFAVGLHHTGYPVGALVGGVVATGVLVVFGNDGWRLVYLASLATIPFAIWYWYLSTRKHQEEVERHDTEQGLTPSTVEEGEREHVTLRSCIEAMKSREVLILAACGFLFQAMQNVFMTSYPEYLKFVGGFSYAAVASLTVVWAITGAFFQFLWPTISDRIGRKWFIVGAGVIQGAVFLLLPISTGLLGVVLVQLLYGVTLNAVFPLLFSSTADVGGKRTGSALGVVFTSIWLGAVAGTLLASEVLEAGGGFKNADSYRVVYLIMVGFSVLVIVLRLLAKETNPRAARTPAAAPAGSP